MYGSIGWQHCAVLPDHEHAFHKVAVLLIPRIIINPFACFAMYDNDVLHVSTISIFTLVRKIYTHATMLYS